MIKYIERLIEHLMEVYMPLIEIVEKAAVIAAPASLVAAIIFSSPRAFECFLGYLSLQWGARMIILVYKK